MSVTFSIGIPAYKSRFLYDCISSILNQTFTGFELIIIDDASPEPVDEVVGSFSDNRIKYFRNEKNVGAENVVDNWNKCLDKADGDFFILMGDDDRMENNFLEEFSVLINKYPLLDIYHCRSLIIDENSKPIDVTPSWPEYESVYENIMYRLGNGRIQFISDFVYRTSTLKKNGGYYKLPLAWSSDDISSYIAIGSKGIAHINKPLLNYRRSTLTISSSGSIDLKIKAVIEMSKWMENFLLKEPADFIDKIVYNDLKRTIKSYIKKRKREILIQSMNQDGVWAGARWFMKRRQYEISGKDIVLSLFGKI